MVYHCCASKQTKLVKEGIQYVMAGIKVKNHYGALIFWFVRVSYIHIYIYAIFLMNIPRHVVSYTVNCRILEKSMLCCECFRKAPCE